jgi:uncharacterized membrane protein
MAANIKIKKIVKKSKMKKFQNPPIWAKIGFQVDYDVAN